MKLRKMIMSLFSLKAKHGAETIIDAPPQKMTDEDNEQAKSLQDWLIIGCSVIGNSHIANNIPCQDAHFMGTLSKNWGIAVVSDGAGSHEYSHYGSAFMVENIVIVLKDLLRHESWFVEGSFPNPVLWQDISIKAFSCVLDNLLDFGDEMNFENPTRTMGGTINLLLYSDNGFLSAHIGDGRSAVQYLDDTWGAAITPFKGEQAGETVFLTSRYTWENTSLCIETRVISKPIKSFAIISDGLEHYCFYCNVKEGSEEKYRDPNIPFEKFFNKNIETIKSLYESGVSRSEIEEKFAIYLKSGHPQISLEPDDKTIVLATKL